MQPLHFAAERGKAEAVKLLLQRGARVNVKNAEKITPLHCAASSGDLRTVELLLEAGADPLSKDTFDQTPRDSLKDATHKNAKIGPLLQSAEKSSPKKAPRKKKHNAPAIPHLWEDAPWEIERPDFSKASKTNEFSEAITFTAKELGVDPSTEDDFPGVRLFEVSRKKASQFVDEHHEELAKRQAMAVYGLGRFSVREEDTDFVMLLPTNDWQQAVAYVQTSDPNGGKGPGQIVAGLQQLCELRPFYITRLAHDTVGGHFTAPAKNSRTLAKWMEAFCSDIIYQGVGSVAALAQELKESDELFFWWD